MPNESDIEQLLLPILDHLLLEHPLPWTVDRDWTWEVIASDKVIIAKCMRQDQAQALVSYVEKRRAQLDKDGEEAEELVRRVKVGEEV